MFASISENITVTLWLNKTKLCFGQRPFFVCPGPYYKKVITNSAARASFPHSTCRWCSVTNRAENICFITWHSRQFLLEWWPPLTCPRPYERAPHMSSRYIIPSVPLLHSTLSALLLISSYHQISLCRLYPRSVQSPLHRQFPVACLLLFTLSYLC